MAATGEPRRLGLELSFQAERVEGRVYEDDGRLDRRFSGWLGLLAAIEAARAAAPAQEEKGEA
jgi:hypothetical protein